ncbi:MAG TPA: Holliday junction branch migration protein RuvA [Alloiococcus sp.]|nr:Holliday junction branch migration protein RuvA [Alloiococcus sp.]
MYEYMIGKLVELYPSYLVLETNGIGYHILMANPFRMTNELEKQVKVYIYQNVTQDSISLFGFSNLNEKNLFLKLINVSGIGPKSALGILANDDHAGLIRAIEAEDAKFLQRFPGVGKKTASQIILDLKGKLQELSPELFDGVAPAGEERSKHGPALVEALEALDALGYSKREVKKVKTKLEDLDPMTTDAYIREALRLLLHQ